MTPDHSCRSWLQIIQAAPSSRSLKPPREQMRPPPALMHSEARPVDLHLAPRNPVCAPWPVQNIAESPGGPAHPPSPPQPPARGPSGALAKAAHLTGGDRQAGGMAGLERMVADWSRRRWGAGRRQAGGKLAQVSHRAVTYEHFRVGPCLKNRKPVISSTRVSSRYSGGRRDAGKNTKGQSVQPQNPGSFTFSRAACLRNM